jgi:hypothetical protein
MRLRIHRTDGKTGTYSQTDTRRAQTLLTRLHPETLLEALGEISFRNGDALYVRVTGVVTRAPLVDAIFGGAALVLSYAPNGTVYVNPKCIVRTRVYHSRDTVDYPDGLWVAEADEI